MEHEKPKTRKRTGRLILIVVAGLALAAAAGVGGTAFYLRNLEQTNFDAAQAAFEAGNFAEAIAALDRAQAVQPEQVRQHDVAGLRLRALAQAGDENWAAAVSDLTAALAVEPGDGELLAARLRANLALGDWPAAIADLDDLLAAEPERSEWLLQRGAASIALGDKPAGMADYARAIASDPALVAPRLERLRWLNAAGDYAAVIKEADAALEADDQVAEFWLLRGLAQLYFRRDSAALTDLNRAVELDEGSAMAWASRGWLHFLRQDYEAARGDGETALALAPDDPLALALAGELDEAVARAPLAEQEAQLLDLRGRYHLASGRPEAALSDAEQALAAAPDWYWPYLLQGDAQLARGQVPQAQFSYQQAVDLEPGAPLVYFGRAAGLAQGGDYAAALADLDRALAELPDYLPARLLHAAAAAQAGDSELALADLAAALAQDPSLVDAYARRASLYMQAGDWQAARADCDQVLADRPDDLPARRQRAEAAFYLGDWEAALADLDVVVADRPDDIDLLVMRSEAHLALGDLEQAMRNARSALELDRGLAWPRYVVGLYELEQQAYFQAVVELTHAIDTDPELAEAYAARSQAHFELYDTDRARADARRALELDPDLARAHLAQALVRAYERDWSGALASAGRALELDQDDAEIWTVRGRIYLEAGDANAALDDFEQALALKPGDAERMLWRAVALDDLQRYDDAVRALQELLDQAADVSEVEQAESSIADLRRIPPADGGYRTWRDAYHGFEITYPADWRQYVDPGEESPLLLMGPLDKDYRATLYMSLFEMDYSLTLSQFARAFGPGGNTLRDYELDSEDSITVGGYRAIRRVFTWTATDDKLRDVPVTVVQVHALMGDRALILTATTRTEGADKYRPVLDDLIASMDFD